MYRTGEYGNEVGKFDFPYLTDVDRGGKLLLADWSNHRYRCWTLAIENAVKSVDRMAYPRCARVGDKYLWVGTGTLFGKRHLMKYECIA